MPIYLLFKSYVENNQNFRITLIIEVSFPSLKAKQLLFGL